MTGEVQHAEVSLNIKRGLCAIVNACMDRLKRRGIPAPLAYGLGNVIVTGIQETDLLPTQEIKITDVARAAGLLRKNPPRERRRHV